MKVVLAVFAAVLLCFNANAFILQTNDAAVQTGLSAAFNITQMPGYINTAGKATNPGQAACYAAYATTTYQIGVVGGAELEFCAEGTNSNCATQEMSQITAQLNTASDQLTACLTTAAISQL